ncbi:CCA tRNA nucleotidyltransferase [Bacillus tuaregi]|uniref:CCA tRNA nucleotidyltransferase n=1 Tax=Bacillus tuaregi TaxID=1816695 RepID=UPI0008F9506D|nr:CCA tRNA nucleotidyltransferase [Bacillus tuaregi]
MMPIFKRAIPLFERLEAAGFEAYFVGGCVRDYILGKEIADVDIATSATPEEVKHIFPKTIDVGIEHGTVIVLWDKETYELTTFRTDGEYHDFRRPSDVTFIRSLEEDLKRRDFTMNSMAMNKEGQIIDPFYGQEAIHNRIIKTVGSAAERFHEDALRMMRAVRFVSQLNFSIDSETFLALKANAGLLEKIATERKTLEFEKLLKGEDRMAGFKLLLDSGLYQYLPGLRNQEKALEQLLQYDIRELTTIEIWSLLLLLVGIETDEAEHFLRKWKLPVKKIKMIKHIVGWVRYRLNSQWNREDLYHAGDEHILPAERIFNIYQHRPISESMAELTEKYEKLTIKSRHQLAVSGHDLMEWCNKTGGPWVNEKLNQIEKAVINNVVNNNRDSIREWLLKCNQS